MNPQSLSLARRTTHLALALLAGLMLAGCGFLKPARPVSRYFVLTPLPAAAPAPAGAPGLGVGQVKLAAYLRETSLAIRKGANEVDYSQQFLWAEKLDTGFQRALAENLAVLLPTDKVRLSAWRSEDVVAEVYVNVERFDVDVAGQGTLIAWWRIGAPGGEKTLQSGEARLTLAGPAPDTDPAGAIATLSGLVGDFSRQLATSIKALPGR
jgi:uncharacterized lipoprotein YmbA